MKVSISELQRHPSLLKQDRILDIVDLRDKKRVGVFIPGRYADLVDEVMGRIEREERIAKLRRLKDDEEMEIWDEASGDGV
jgi:hypothetical protein